MITFDKQRLKRNLSYLTRTQQVAFALLLCERMFPALRKFGADAAFDVTPFRNFLDRAWASFERPHPADCYRELSRECYARAPDTEDFSHPLTSAALDACLSIGFLMEFLADHNVDHLVETAALAHDTVFMLAQAAGSLHIPESIPMLDEQPIVQRELGRQTEDLTFLENLPPVDDREVISRSRARAGEAPAMIPP